MRTVESHCIEIAAACEGLETDALGDCVAHQVCEGSVESHDTFFVACGEPPNGCAGPCDVQACDTEGPVVGGCGEARSEESCAFRTDDEGTDCGWYSVYPVELVDGACVFGKPFGMCEITQRGDDGCWYDYGIWIGATPAGDIVVMDANGTCDGPADAFEPCDSVTDETQLAICACATEYGSPV